MNSTGRPARKRPAPVKEELPVLGGRLLRSAMYAIGVETAAARGPLWVTALLGALDENRPAALISPLHPEGETFSTMAGLAIDLAGRIPDQGSVLRTEDGVTLEILEATPRRIRLIRLRRAPTPAVADEPN